jgi:hypothetical protein
MNRPAGILRDCAAKNFNLAGIRVDFDIDHRDRECRPHVARVDAGPYGNRASSAREPARELGESPTLSKPS